MFVNHNILSKKKNTSVIKNYIEYIYINNKNAMHTEIKVLSQKKKNTRIKDVIKI